MPLLRASLAHVVVILLAYSCLSIWLAGVTRLVLLADVIRLWVLDMPFVLCCIVLLKLCVTRSCR